MPGFNQQGPMNEGAMTGRGRGICTGAVHPDQGFGGRGNGMGRQRGRRFSQSAGWGRGQDRWNSPGVGPVNVTQDGLQEKVNRLETELAAVKNQLKNMPGVTE